MCAFITSQYCHQFILHSAENQSMISKKKKLERDKLQQSVALAWHLRQGLRVNHENPVITAIRNAYIPNAGQKRGRLSNVAQLSSGR